RDQWLLRQPARPGAHERDAAREPEHGEEEATDGQDILVHACSSCLRATPVGALRRQAGPDLRAARRACRRPHGLAPPAVPAPRASPVCALTASTRPWCATTVCFTIASPRPVPPVFAVTYGSQMRSSCSAAMPCPSSRTATVTSPSARDTRRTRRPLPSIAST